VQSIAPTIFTANEGGTGTPAALIQRFYPDGTYDYEVVGSSIAFNGDSLYLLLFGTGFDAGTTGNTTVTVGGAAAALTYSGPAPGFAGLDQIDVALPGSLAGEGQVTVNVMVNQVAANAVTIVFQ
jgi:uncharacterized protein (TIGR03437 family)